MSSPNESSAESTTLVQNTLLSDGENRALKGILQAGRRTVRECMRPLDSVTMLEVDIVFDKQ